MNPDEYARMRAVEDRHWWYNALRRLVWDAWAECAHDSALPWLDIGCGTGGTVAGAPGPAFAVDRSRDALRFCLERGQRGLAQSDAAALPFADGRFSGALLLDVLYHRAVRDPLAILGEARRVIVPGGHIVVNVPAYEWLRSSHDEAIHTGRRFTATQLRALLCNAGFGVVRLTYWNTLLFPVAAAVRLFRRDSGRQTSDLANYQENAATDVARGVLTLERALLRAVNLPFGLSIFAVARKPASGP